MKFKQITFIALLLCTHILYAQNNSITLDGNDEYIDLPSGIANYDNFTFEAWVFWNGPTNEPWQRIFDFGNSSNTGIMLPGLIVQTLNLYVSMVLRRFRELQIVLFTMA